MAVLEYAEPKKVAEILFRMLTERRAEMERDAFEIIREQLMEADGTRIRFEEPVLDEIDKYLRRRDWTIVRHPRNYTMLIAVHYEDLPRPKSCERKISF